jgi:hypothetical protein
MFPSLRWEQSLMAKKHVSADELVWLFSEELNKTGKFPVGISIAIVPDRAANWTAITGARYRAMSPDLARRFAQVQERLRAIYQLKND